MLEVLEKRRDALWKREERLSKAMQQAAQQGESVKAGDLFESCGVLSRLRLYSDYERLQNANERNIEEILNEIIAGVREEQNKAFNDIERQGKDLKEVASDPCDLADMQIGVLRAVEREATDLLALFNILNALELLESVKGKDGVNV